MADTACTFSATPGPLYPSFPKVALQTGCCVTSGDGTVTAAYGINNTCHVLYYGGEAAPYRITTLEQNAGNLSLSIGSCAAFVLEIETKGTYAAGNGSGPNDAGLASKYGYDGCVVGASSNPYTASSRKSSAASTVLARPLVGSKTLLLLAMAASLLSFL